MEESSRPACSCKIAPGRSRWGSHRGSRSGTARHGDQTLERHRGAVATVPLHRRPSSARGWRWPRCASRTRRTRRPDLERAEAAAYDEHSNSVTAEHNPTFEAMIRDMLGRNLALLQWRRRPLTRSLRAASWRTRGALGDGFVESFALKRTPAGPGWRAARREPDLFTRHLELSLQLAQRGWRCGYAFEGMAACAAAVRRSRACRCAARCGRATRLRHGTRRPALILHVSALRRADPRRRMVPRSSRRPAGVADGCPDARRDRPA